MGIWTRLRHWILWLEHLVESSGRPAGTRSVFRSRRLIAFVLQAYIIIFTAVFSFLIRFEFRTDAADWKLIVPFLATVLVVKLPLMHLFDLNRGWWRYSSLSDAFSVLKATAAGTFVIAALQFLSVTPFYPRSVLAIDFLLSFVFLTGVRAFFRVIHEQGSSAHPRRRREDKRVLIVGAGDAGCTLVQKLRKSEGYLPNVVGFVDDSPKKQGQKFYGVPVLGKISDIPQIKENYTINEVYIAIPSLNKAGLNRVTEICLAAKVSFKRIPSLKQIINMGSLVDHLQPVRVEDLLGREPISLDKTQTSEEIRGQVVMVTGAGGSIGSELCRQILSFQPRKLILVERSEYNLFSVFNELRKSYQNIQIEAVVGDIQDFVGLERVFEKYHPELVYHAAAHKHVPLMEWSPREAVRNNVIGTKNLADLSCQFHAKKFVMISTDKAVNPLNVMGYSKRLAELVVQSRANNGTEFISVRFGNVLGSSGSAVEIFRKQIASGGPLTVTHPQATRFFMTTPEAVELVLHAGAHGRSGEIYMLDMGKPVRILDLAKRMIELSDPEGKRDLKIEIIGLRPGEKVSEEIVWEGEDFAPSEIDKVHRLKNKVCTKALPELLAVLEKELNNLDAEPAHQLKAIVDELDHLVRNEISEEDQTRLKRLAQELGSPSAARSAVSRRVH